MYVPGQQTMSLADYPHFCTSLPPGHVGVTAFRSVELKGNARKTKCSGTVRNRGGREMVTVEG